MSRRPILSTVISLSLLVCCGQTASNCNENPQPTHIGPSGAEVAGAVVGVAAVATTAIVLVSVNHSHHNLKGCLFDSPSGTLQLRTENLKDYTLIGSTTNLAVGHSVHVHGSREKQKDKNAGQVFIVTELKKNYGPCSVLAASVPSPGVPAGSNPANSQLHP